MQHHRYICFFALSLWVVVAQAQGPAEALRAAEARFLALGSYSATMGYVASEHRDIGKVYYQGNKSQLDYPEDQTICDGSKTMFWSKEFAAINFPEPITTPDLSAGGVYGLHRFHYQFEWVDTMGYMLRMRLTASDPNLAPPEVLLGIGRKSGLIEEYSVFFRDFSMEMKVLDFQLNPVLDPKLFVIDMDFVRRVENGEVPAVVHDH
jgi:hypothetical protein